MPLQSPSNLDTERLLCLSNGHGEDIIAVRILQALQQQPDCPKLYALPLVGEGFAYQHLGVPLVGPMKSMPSGGFIYMDGGRQLVRDVHGGLLQLTWAQFKAIRRWAKQGGSILAVGDIFPLLLAYLSGAPFAFVGTAKSEYYLRDENGCFFPQTWLEGWSGSVYYPWERWMMGCDRCRAVFPRDTLTTKFLQQWAIPAFDLGNPMMDGLEPKMPRSSIPNAVSAGHDWLDTEASTWRSATGMDAILPRYYSYHDNELRIVLLPGSRIPEAYENWQLILAALDDILNQFSEQPITFLAAISPNLKLEPLRYPLIEQGWQASSDAIQTKHSLWQSFPDRTADWFYQSQATLILTQHAYADCLDWADWAIAMTGTATEQFVGLGKPAISLVGKGPQFIYRFAEAQTRLLGESVTLVERPEQVAIAIQTLQRSPETLQRIAENGHRRMGEAGAAYRIANCLMQQLA